MLVVSGGLQKSGSALCFNLLNELLMAEGFSDTRTIRKEYDLEDIIIADDCYIYTLNKDVFKRLLKPLNDGKSFVVKTHRFPSNDYFEFLRDNELDFDIKYIYTIRDPRDTLISAMDHYKKDPSAFKEFDTFEHGLISIQQHLKESQKWLNFNEVLTLRYEEFSIDITSALKQISDYLNLTAIDDTVMSSIKKRYSKDSCSNWDSETKKFSRLHFNKGETKRYLKNLSAQELQLLENLIRDEIVKLGYTLETKVNEGGTAQLDLTVFLKSVNSKN